jgi:hypothetical protein
MQTFKQIGSRLQVAPKKKSKSSEKLVGAAF